MVDDLIVTFKIGSLIDEIPVRKSHIGGFSFQFLVNSLTLMRHVQVETAVFRQCRLFVDVVSPRGLLLVYLFYAVMNVFFFFAGFCCPSPIAEQSSSVDISYHDGASIVPVHLAIRHLTSDNHFVSVKVQADRLNLLDSEPLTLRYERNIQCFSRSRVISSSFDDRGNVGLPWVTEQSNSVLLSTHDLF
jgi:hypothetical protein